MKINLSTLSISYIQMNEWNDFARSSTRDVNKLEETLSINQFPSTKHIKQIQKDTL
jgi:hypothetical protein